MLDIFSRSVITCQVPGMVCWRWDHSYASTLPYAGLQHSPEQSRRRFQLPISPASFEYSLARTDGVNVSIYRRTLVTNTRVSDACCPRTKIEPLRERPHIRGLAPREQWAHRPGKVAMALDSAKSYRVTTTALRGTGGTPQYNRPRCKRWYRGCGGARGRRRPGGDNPPDRAGHAFA